MFPLNHPVKIGLVAGILLIVYTAILYAFDIDIYDFVFSIVNGIIIFGLLIFAAILAMKKMRDISLAGKITYLQALVGGFVVFLIAFYLSSIFSFILNGYIDPEYLPAKMDGLISKMEDMMPEEALDKMISKLEEGLDPMTALIKALWQSPLIALGLSALLALFVKKDTTSANLA